MLVTIERSVFTDGGFDRFYGLPFGYISNNSGCTHCFEVSILYLVVDLICYFAFTILFFWLLKKFNLDLPRYRALQVLGLLISIFWIFVFYTTVFESRFQFLDVYPFERISMRLHIGTYPW